MICYTNFHCSQKAASTLVPKCYSHDWMNFHDNDQLYLVLLSPLIEKFQFCTHMVCQVHAQVI
jgi:hypothetical protein